MASNFEPNSELSKICTQLWEADENRLVPGRDYQINLQGGKEIASKEIFFIIPAQLAL